MYSLDDIRKSIKLINFLLERGELTENDDAELYSLFSDASVREILEVYGEESSVSIKKYDDTIYFIPGTDNEFLGYKRAELKKEIFPRGDMKNIDLFLAMYIIILLTAEFYSGKGTNVKIRDLISLGELDEKITERLELFEDEEDNSKYAVTGIAITDISKYWFTLINEDDSEIMRTRRWYINQVMNFLKKEGLINIQDETVIIPTAKFNRLASNYFLNYDRLEYIENILNKKKEDNNA
ncbi:MAG: DUF6063 family protein [Clostridiaceae bacterium]